MKPKLGMKFRFLGETPDGGIKMQGWEVINMTSKLAFIQSLDYPEIQSKFSINQLNQLVKRTNIIK